MSSQAAGGGTLDLGLRPGERPAPRHPAPPSTTPPPAPSATPPVADATILVASRNEVPVATPTLAASAPAAPISVPATPVPATPAPTIPVAIMPAPEAPVLVRPVSGARTVAPSAILDLTPAVDAVAPGPPAPSFGTLATRARGILGRAAGFAVGAAVARARQWRGTGWRGLRFRATGSIAPMSAAAATPGDTLTEPAARHKKSWREQRWERRRRRRVTEEVLGWILVPVILIASFWAVKSGLNALGTTPTALIQGIKAAVSGRGGG